MNKFLIAIAVVLLSNCKAGDPNTALTTKDGSLTSFGCLVYRPWYFEREVYNKKVYYKDSLVSSKAAKYLSSEKDLVFELKKNLSMKYWSKGDQPLHAEVSADGRVYRTFPDSTDYAKIKNVYEGNWKFDPADSSLYLNFVDPRMLLVNISTKCMNLGSTSMTIVQIGSIDSLINNKAEKFKIVTTKYLTH